MSTTFHYTLTKRQSILWNHCNPDMRRWGQKRVLSVIETVAPDYETVKIFDTDESYLGTVLDSEKWCG